MLRISCDVQLFSIYIIPHNHSFLFDDDVNSRDVILLHFYTVVCTHKQNSWSVAQRYIDEQLA
jgi:hypothetical protein